jgi:WD40 repeat protein
LPTLNGGINDLYPCADNRHLLINVDNEGLYVYDLINETDLMKFDVFLGLHCLIPGRSSSEIVFRNRTGDVFVLNLESMNIEKLFNSYEMLRADSELCGDESGNIYLVTKDIVEKSKSGNIYVYNIAERGIINTFTIPNAGYSNRLVFNKDRSKMLVINSSSIRIWDMASEKYVLDLVVDERRCRSARFSPDDKYVITACANKVQLWDVKSGQCFQTIKYDAMLGETAISPDGNRMAFSSTDKKIQVRHVIPVKSLIEEARSCYTHTGLSEAERKALHLEL